MRKDTEELIESAKEDFYASLSLYEMRYLRTCCFHAHQFVEKMLKAFLLEKVGSYPFTHSISTLIMECVKVDKDFEYLYDITADKLDKYYTGTRYPPIIKVNEEEAKKVVDILKKVKDFRCSRHS